MTVFEQWVVAYWLVGLAIAMIDGLINWGAITKDFGAHEGIPLPADVAILSIAVLIFTAVWPVYVVETAANLVRRKK